MAEQVFAPMVRRRTVAARLCSCESARLIRSLTLYPTELRARDGGSSGKPNAAVQAGVRSDQGDAARLAGGRRPRIREISLNRS
jgi:hypothetical protein